MKKAIEVETSGNLIKTWLKMKNMFIKKFILDTLNEIFNEKILDDQVKLEYLQYILGSTSSTFWNKLAKNTKNNFLT